jgi:hypothetical protein
MQRAGQKNTRLKSRAEALERELARMDAEIKSLSRAAMHPDREAAMRRLRRLTEEQDAARERLASRDAARAEEADRAKRMVPMPERGAPAVETPGIAAQAPVPREGPDGRFAKYFVTGSLQSSRPLRQERRVQRNKAIVMTILALVLLYGVFSLIF